MKNGRVMDETGLVQLPRVYISIDGGGMIGNMAIPRPMAKAKASISKPPRGVMGGAKFSLPMAVRSMTRV
jgi:hypothetical protein